MTVRISHAVCSESNSKYGKLGDQTTKEVRLDDWYNDGWNVVLRPKDKTRAERIATAMEQAAKNDKIGYTQSQRTTLYIEASKVGFDLSKIETVCGCDCSSLVAVCVNAAGIKVSKDIYTGNMVKVLMATGEFEQLPNTNRYLEESSYLMRGDILVHEGSHTAVVLIDGNKVVKKDYKEVNYFGAVSAFWLNVRYEATSKSKVLKTIKKNTVVHITRQKDNWGYVESFNGWVSLSYIKKVDGVKDDKFEPYVGTTITTVNFRTAPNSNVSNNIITKFNKGQVLYIINKNNDGWVYGKTTINGQVKNGWIFEEYLEEINLKCFQKRMVTDATGLNIRDKGNIKASKLATIPFGKEFYVIKDGTWGVVLYNDVLGYSSLSKSYSEKV